MHTSLTLRGYFVKTLAILVVCCGLNLNYASAQGDGVTAEYGADRKVGLKMDLGGGISLTILKSGTGPTMVPGGMIKGYLEIRSSSGDLLRVDRREEGPQPMPVDRPAHAADVQHALLKLRAGDSARIEIENDSALAHPGAPRMLKSGERTIFIVKVVTVLNSVEAMLEISRISAEWNAKLEEQENEDEAIMKEDSTTLAAFIAKKKIKAKRHAEGYYIETLKAGSGPKSKMNDLLTVNYVGTLLNGTVFDQNRGEPFRFHVGGEYVVPALSIASAGLQKGQKIKLYVPSFLGYGPTGVPPDDDTIGIPPRSHLIFEIEVLEISKAEE